MKITEIHKPNEHFEPGGGGYSHIQWVCMCHSVLKRRGLTELIKMKKWVLSELAER